MFKNKFVAFFVFALISAPTLAGQFFTHSYGPAESSDITAIVTEKFTEKYPVKRWEIFMYSAAFLSEDGIMSCFGIAGVVPRNSHQIPKLRFHEANHQINSESETEADINSYAVKCGVGAVQDMMDELSNGGEIYTPYK